MSRKFGGRMEEFEQLDQGASTLVQEAGYEWELAARQAGIEYAHSQAGEAFHENGRLYHCPCRGLGRRMPGCGHGVHVNAYYII